MSQGNSEARQKISIHWKWRPEAGFRAIQGKSSCESSLLGFRATKNDFKRIKSLLVYTDNTFREFRTEFGVCLELDIFALGNRSHDKVGA